MVAAGRLRSDQLGVLRRACAGRSLTFAAHGPLAINFFDEPHRLPHHFEVMAASMEAAAVLGAVHYVVHAGIAPIQQHVGLEAAYARQREWLARAGDLAQQLGVIVCVETMYARDWRSLHTPSASQLAQELRLIGHAHVLATIDFSHAYLRLGNHCPDYVAEIETLAPLARHLHIHDSFGCPDDIWMYGPGDRLAFGHGDLHLPAGWGNIPWPTLMAACRFPRGVLFNVELDARYADAAEIAVAAARALAETAHIARPVKGEPLLGGH